MRRRTSPVRRAVNFAVLCSAVMLACGSLTIAAQSSSRSASSRRKQRGLDDKPRIDDALATLQPGLPLRDQLRVLRDVVGLKDREIAFVARTSVATIRRWRQHGEAQCPPTYDDLRVVVERLLSESTMEPRLISAWLRSRNVGLGYDRPLSALQQEGNFERVMSVVESLVAGALPIEAPRPALAHIDEKSFSAPESPEAPDSLLTEEAQGDPDSDARVGDSQGRGTRQ